MAETKKEKSKKQDRACNVCRKTGCSVGRGLVSKDGKNLTHPTLDGAFSRSTLVGEEKLAEAPPSFFLFPNAYVCMYGMLSFTRLLALDDDDGGI